MHEAARIQYDTLARIGDASVNAALLAQFDARRPGGPSDEEVHLFRANLLRRGGDLSGARAAFRNAGPGGEAPQPHLAIPPGRTTRPDNFIAPLIVIDDLLPPEEMAALHNHACEIEKSFRHARLSSGDNSYDPDKRETLLTWDFDYLRQHFLDYIESNLGRFQNALGMPPFAAAQSEIKLTNHLDGGFFNTHRDNHGQPVEDGRALTWLYYFSKTPPRFSGGELFILDSNPAKKQSSDSFFTKVAPRPNRFVAFPSWFYHAVGPTRLPGNAFADGRFAVSGHVHKPADTLEWPW